jgi:hypothetical protein
LPAWVRESFSLNHLRIAFFIPNRPPVWHIFEGHGSSLIKIFEKECKEKGIAILKDVSEKDIA